MNRKTIIICLTSLVILVGLIVAGLVALYSPEGKSPAADPSAGRSEYRLFQAVPSDAAMLMSFSKASDAFSFVTDSTQLFSVLMTDAASSRNAFSRFTRLVDSRTLGSLRGEDAVISVHYSGTLEPFMAIVAGSAPSDTTADVRRIMDAADSAGLLHRLVDCSRVADASSRLRKSMLLLLSPSETLLTASERHLEGGMSIFDRNSFPQAAAAAGGRDALFVSHDYISKLLPVHMLRPYTGYSQFLGRYAEWTVLGVRNSSTRKLTMAGMSVVSEKEQTAFANVAARVSGGEMLFTDIVPSSTLFAVSVSASSLSGYEEAYVAYLDAVGRKDRFGSVSKSVCDSLGTTPVRWIGNLDVREVAKADVLSGDEVVSVLFLRPGKSVREPREIQENPYRGWAASVFGSLFTVEDSHYVSRSGWLVFGPAEVLEGIGTTSLKAELASMDLSSPSKGTNFAAYFSFSKSQSRLESIFRPSMLKAIRQSLVGITDQAAMLSISGTSISLDVARASLALPDRMSDEAMASMDITVEVPQGPFTVKNSGTGRNNTFGQASNGSLSLKDENGKGLWAVPFSGKLCGYVETIDYYANDKLQFLFASGSKLYLMDRLGRFVNPFPVDLGKEIVLGPAAYDFTGAHGYTAIVLHSDNTIGMYDLHGKLRQDWKGITSEEKIMALPELIQAGSKKYWAVRTYAQTLIYPFMGGDPVTRLTGEKRIRPDSEIMVKEGTVSATSLDGKVRNIKLEK